MPLPLVRSGASSQQHLEHFATVCAESKAEREGLMRKTFPGYYRPAEEEFYALWNTCLFVLDANVLLNLYRYSQETSDELIGILKQVSDRLWVPHQAALEYQRQRLQVIAQQLEAYDEMQELLGKTKNQLEDKLHSLHRHPYINADYLLKRIQRAFAAIERDLNKLKREHPDLLQHYNGPRKLDTEKARNKIEYRP